MIDIVTMRSKFKGIRVDIYRRFRETDPATHKIIHSKKQIGSFKLTPEFTYPDELNEVMAPDEVLQLKNWLADARFAAQFNEEADSLAKFAIRMPQKLYDAYVALAEEAKREEMDFIPNQIMLETLLHKAKLVEQKMNKLRKKPIKILESVGVQTDSLMSDDDYQRLLDVESRALFKALLALAQPISKTCSELEAIAKRYGKNKERISPMQLKEWAGVLPDRKLKKVNRWIYAMAIDLLLAHDKAPLQLAPPERVTEYWVIQHQSQFTLEQAKNEFSKRFHPANAIKPKLLKIIEEQYKSL